MLYIKQFPVAIFSPLNLYKNLELNTKDWSCGRQFFSRTRSGKMVHAVMWVMGSGRWSSLACPLLTSCRMAPFLTGGWGPLLYTAHNRKKLSFYGFLFVQSLAKSYASWVFIKAFHILFHLPSLPLIPCPVTHELSSLMTNHFQPLVCSFAHVFTYSHAHSFSN